MFMPELGPDDAQQMLERVRVALSQLTPDLSCDVTASIGAVTFMRAPDDVQAMVQMADAAMYAAKEDGKNRVRLQLIDRDVAMVKIYPPADA